jgi:hypothetical protein
VLCKASKDGLPFVPSWFSANCVRFFYALLAWKGAASKYSALNLVRNCPCEIYGCQIPVCPGVDGMALSQSVFVVTPFNMVLLCSFSL